MDWVMADIGMENEIKVNDEVELFGRNYPAYKLANLPVQFHMKLHVMFHPG